MKPVRCYRAVGTLAAPTGVPVVSADDISDTMIVTEDMAALRGKRYLDDPDQGGYYGTYKYTLSVPHKSELCIPSKVVKMTVSDLGLTDQKLKIKSYRIKPGTAGIWAEMEVESYHVPAIVPVV